MEQGGDRSMESEDGNGASWLQVLTELSHIMELVRRLHAHLGVSPDQCKHLVSQIVSTTERSIALVTSGDLDAGPKLAAADAGLALPPAPGRIIGATGVPFKNANSKKRKVTGRRLEVKVSSAAGGDGPVDDGQSWRKYGNKGILGAKYPRAYYRCRHRHTQGCTAMKKVQRCDEDPTLFDVIYHGTHTCIQPAGEATTQPPEASPGAQSLTVATEAVLGVPPTAEPPQGRSAAAGPFYFSTPGTSGGSLAPERSPLSGNWGASPATSVSNHAVALPPFEAAGEAEWRARSEFQEVVSALVEAASSPAAPAAAVNMELCDADEFLNLDAAIEASLFFA